MAIENDFLPFATGGGANVMPQTNYAALPALSTGYQAGIASSAQMNKTWRQSSIMAAMIAQFIVDYSGQPALDDGTTATLEANFLAGLKAQLAALGGNSAQTFNVAAATASANAVNLGQFASTIGSAGRVTFPIFVGGVQKTAFLQYGQVSQAGQSTVTYTFPIAFPNACFGVWAGKGTSVTITGEYAVAAQSTSTSQFQLANTAASTGSQGLWWFALGY